MSNMLGNEKSMNQIKDNQDSTEQGSKIKPFLERGDKDSFGDPSRIKPQVKKKGQYKINSRGVYPSK